MQAIKISAIQIIAEWLDEFSQPQLLMSQTMAAKKANPNATPSVPRDRQVAWAKNIHKASSATPTTAWMG